jgi:hypothetical protein
MLDSEYCNIFGTTDIVKKYTINTFINFLYYAFLLCILFKELMKFDKFIRQDVSMGTGGWGGGRKQDISLLDFWKHI